MDEKTKKQALEALERQKKRYKKQNEYLKNTYDRVSVTLPKGTKERIAKSGDTVNNFIKEAILKELENKNL